jgi:hypothetical protein
MAVATMTETVDPPPVSRPGKAAPPASDPTMSVNALGAPHIPATFFIVQADLYQFKQL